VRESSRVWSFLFNAFLWLWILALGIRKSEKFCHNYNSPDCDDCCNKVLKHKISWWKRGLNYKYEESGKLHGGSVLKLRCWEGVFWKNLGNEAGTLNFIFKGRETTYCLIKNNWADEKTWNYNYPNSVGHIDMNMENEEVQGDFCVIQWFLERCILDVQMYWCSWDK
jgi:hypothetical protein